MRKRIVIGVLAIIAVGVLAFVLSQPRKGSVEYHKRKYLEAYGKGALADLVVGRGVSTVDRMHWKFRRKRIEFHRQALIDAGFFEQKEFVFSNRPPREVIRAVLSDLGRSFTNETDHLIVPLIRGVTSNSITIVAERRAMREVEGFVRNADLPEK